MDPKKKLIYVLVMLALCVVLVLSMLYNAAHAAGTYYTVFGVGQSKLDNKDDLWHEFAITTNVGYQSKKQEWSPGWRAGIGKLYTWGAAEVAYSDDGQMFSYAGYPYDPGAPGSSPGGCAWPCTPTQWVEHSGYVRSIMGRLLPEYKFTDSFALVFSAGVKAYYAKFEYAIANEAGNPYEKIFSTQKDCSSVGLSAMWGLGVRWDNFILRWDRSDSVAAKCHGNGKGAFQRLDQFMLEHRTYF